MDIRQFITKLTPKGWAMVGGSAAAAVVFLVVIMHFASAPSYSTMLTGLDPAQTGKITSTLDAKGIAYQIQNGGTALAVAPNQQDELVGDNSQRSSASVLLSDSGNVDSSQVKGIAELVASSVQGLDDQKV